MKYSKISRLFLAWLTLFVLMGSFLPWGGLVPSAQAATLDPAQWAHRRSITIDNTGNANALTDYQVKVDTNDVFYDEEGLVGSWHMNEGAGVTVSDSSGNGNSAANNYYDIDTFEGGPGSSDDWSERNWQNPTVTSLTAYAGTYSLHMDTTDGGWGRNFEGSDGIETGQSSSGYDTNSYPYMCTAYRIPSTTRNNMLIRVSGAWKSITMTAGESPTSYPKVATWNPLTADNQWHYKCINLDAQLDSSLGTGAHTIDAVIWHGDTGFGGGIHGYGITGEFWIDDFTISTNPGPTWVTGKYGSALSFEGSGDYLDPATDIDLGNTWTVTTWFKSPLEESSHWRTLIRGAGGDHQIIVQSGAYDLGSFDNTGETGFKDSGFDMDTLTDGWHHLAVVQDGTNILFYIDGSHVGTISNYISTTDITAIGNYQGGGQEWGTIDEFRIYNRALSLPEVQAQYNASDVRPDYGDVRFTDFDGSTLLDYWMEKDGTFWVKVPSIPASSNKTIYMYYGNLSAESISDGDNTFEFFDDFSGDLSKWQAMVGDPFSISSGKLRFYNTGVDNNYLRALTSVGASEIIIETKLKSNHTSGNGHPGVMWHANTSTASNHRNDHVYVRPHSYNTSSNIQPAYYSGSLSAFGATAGLYNYNTWYDIKIEIPSPNSIKYYRDGVNEANWSDQQYQSNTYVGVAAHNAYETFWDDFRVRQYTSPEPTITINEENYPPSVPVHLYTNDSINPTDITSSSLTLSAEYDDADTSDTASFYEIQVIADGGSWASPYWDSAKSACSVDEGDRLAITYSGSALDLNYQKYYQRWKFWDSLGAEGDWSDGTDYFVTAVPKNEYGANVGGYAWSDNIGWLSFNNNDTTSFVASYNAGTGQLEGWGWSDGIGWVSLNCATDEQCNPATEDHKVIIDVSGDLSGEAWSDNLGWLSFDRSDTGNPPGEPYQASGAIAHYDSSAMEFSGWARFLTAPEGGWDGWIKLRCYGAECSESGWSDGKGATSGVFIDDGGYLQGWAWGSDVVGWLGFKGPGSVDYGVDIDEENNKLSGHVWSENLGWISFDRDETGTPPSDDPCVDESCLARLKSDNYQLDGWMRALNYGDGWDGWISLNKKTGDSFDYEVVFNPNSKEFEGWAYGSDVLGWISFNHLTDGSSVDYMVYSGLPMGIQPTDPHDTWDLCADSLHPTLNWSVAGEINGYEVEIYSDADLNNLVYLYQADMASTSHHAGYDASNIDDTEGTCHLSGNGFQNEPDCNLHYGGTSYWWRVRVRNLDDVWGEWSTIDDFTVVSDHHWPIPSFSTNPENPQTGSVTHFLDETAVYGGATAVSWQWLFSGGLRTDYEYANETSSVSQNPDITFLNNNSETVGLETTDSDDYGPCSCSGLVDITSGSIQWQEVSPTP